MNIDQTNSNGWEPPRFQFAYALGEQDDAGSERWKKWQRLNREDVAAAARFITPGEGAGEFKEFARTFAAEMREGETLIEALKRFGYLYHDEEAA